MTTVTGYVRDRNGDLLADAVVHLIRRDTGALLGSAVSGDGSEAVDGDADYASVSLLLHCNGTDGSTTFTDNSSSPKTITVSGGARIESDQAKFGGTSLYLPGTGVDRIQVNYDASLHFGGGDFTVEFWFYPTSSARSGLLAYATDYCLAIDYHFNGTRNINMWASSTGSTWDILQSDAAGTASSGIGSLSLALNDWNHIAFTRSGDVWRSFVNGVKDLEKTRTGTTKNNGQALRIGRWGNDDLQTRGYYNDVRITKGVARYTATFTPPTAAFLNYFEIPARPLGQYNIDTTYSGEVQRIVCAPNAWDPIANDLIDRITLP